MLETDRSAISDTAWACVIYSIVPYLGILFVPFALVAGGLGVYSARRKSETSRRRLAVLCVGSSLLILGLQIILWWLLYVIPILNIQN